MEVNEEHYDSIDNKNHSIGIKSGRWEHVKTGNIYNVINVVINTTNENDGQTMVLYQREGMMFVRESKEFLEKFVKRNDRRRDDYEKKEI